LYTTSNGSGLGWQPYTKVQSVNNVRDYTPGRIRYAPLSVESTLVSGKDNLQIWHNGAASSLAITVKDGAIVKPTALTISDVTGKRVKTITLNPVSGEQIFPVQLKTGVYIYQSELGSGKVVVW
jgi:hypothetical protein